MGYQKQNFADGQVLNSAHLNHIEDGIIALESFANTSLTGKADKSEVQANEEKIFAESARAKAAESAINETISTIIDPTLSVSGKAADAKATGDAIRNVAEGVAGEAKRAVGEEQRLNTAINAEKTRAEQAEQALDTRTAALESCGFVVVDGKICVRYLKR